MAGLPSIDPYPMPLPGDFPPSVVGWQVDPRRAVLLVHDMQEYFLRPFEQGTSPRDPLVSNVILLRERCAELGIPVAYTAQPGGMTTEERGLLADFWGPGMRTAPEHRRLVAGLEPAPGDWMFTKWRYSAFFNSGLQERMRSEGRDQLVICGVYAHVGVLMTVVDAFTRDIQPFLVGDAVADFSASYHRIALTYAAERAAAVVTTASLCEALAAVPTGERR
ncbi:isochorismatase family protein [Streptomyces sp. NPDC059957]|uniref:isochorismatase family protein n=1 Tax=unclassified Streptomyces TaxID=2593676 RepID=UPI003647B7E6